MSRVTKLLFLLFLLAMAVTSPAVAQIGYPDEILVSTPTPLPPNPVEVTPVDVLLSIGYGGLGIILLFVIFGIFFWLRRKKYD